MAYKGMAVQKLLEMEEEEHAMGGHPMGDGVGTTGAMGAGAMGPGGPGPFGPGMSTAGKNPEMTKDQEKMSKVKKSVAMLHSGY
jgi:hypothetical protein